MNWWGIIVSFAYVFLFIGIAQWLLGVGAISPPVARKIVHIGVAHWWIIAMVFFNRWEFAIAVPAAFIVINLASYVLRLLPAIEHTERRRNLGTVYFPVALLVCVLATWSGPIPIWMGGAGILVLGWGDGLASLVGETRTTGIIRVFGHRKSVGGSLTMLAASTVVLLAFLALYATPGEGLLAGSILLTAVVVAAIATFVELVTPYGLDNLTVPVVAMLVLFTA